MIDYVPAHHPASAVGDLTEVVCRGKSPFIRSPRLLRCRGCNDERKKLDLLALRPRHPEGERSRLIQLALFAACGRIGLYMVRAGSVDAIRQASQTTITIRATANGAAATRYGRQS
jgi:hypothetical protein